MKVAVSGESMGVHLREAGGLAGSDEGVGRPNVVLLENHGALTFGKTVREAWVNLYYLEKMCRTYLELLAAAGGEIPDSEEVEKKRKVQLRIPSQELQLQNASYFLLPEYAPGQKEWSALRGSVLK